MFLQTIGYQQFMSWAANLAFLLADYIAKLLIIIIILDVL